MMQGLYNQVEVAMQNILSKHIETTPGVCGGKPRIAGHRITVQNVAIWHERMGMSADKIVDEYGLMLSEVYAALAYYYDNRDEIDRTIRDDEEFVESLRQGARSKLKEKTGG
jgi:uncharacterized protein (DUF433 family)